MPIFVMRKMTKISTSAAAESNGKRIFTNVYAVMGRGSEAGAYEKGKRYANKNASLR
jgi:hypothetical protein